MTIKSFNHITFKVEGSSTLWEYQTPYAHGLSVSLQTMLRWENVDFSPKNQLNVCGNAAIETRLHIITECNGYNFVLVGNPTLSISYTTTNVPFASKQSVAVHVSSISSVTSFSPFLPFFYCHTYLNSVTSYPTTFEHLVTN